jgi:hypothetical protein
MQKLSLWYRSLRRQVRPEQGSALVGAVAFSIILFIASLGYLQVVASSRNYETTGFWDDKAFTAAESGLLLGARWLSQQEPSNNEQYPFSGITPNPRDVYAVTFDGIPVSVSIAFSHDTAKIQSTATTGMLTYSKRLVRTMVALPLTAGGYGVYLDDAWNLGGNTDGIRKLNWDGPAHFNTAIKLGNPGVGNEVHFNDRVSLFNIDPTRAPPEPVYNPTYDSMGHFGNDYRSGVTGGSGRWDSIFQRTYNPNADRIGTYLNTSDSTNISLNAGDSSLTFGVNNGNPFYQYKNGAGTITPVSYDPAIDLKIHIVNKGVSVSGIVKGKVTVYTDLGNDIYLPGNLMYADFSVSSFSSNDLSTNYGFGMTSQNIIGLYSGGDLVVAKGTHYITALLFAVNKPNGTLLFKDDRQQQTTFNLFGSLAVKNFWDPPQGNNQATFIPRWDHRASSAPGLGFKRELDDGSFALSLNPGAWTERNFK